MVPWGATKSLQRAPSARFFLCPSAHLFVSARRAYLDTAAPGGTDDCTQIKAAELIFLTADLPEILILTQI
jgi:hypothetical protein